MFGWLFPPQAVYVPPKSTRNEAGLDLRFGSQISRLKAWGKYRPLLESLANDEAINTSGKRGQHIHNGFYPTPDAEIYSCMILDYRPDVIVEVGSGFSTLIARKTIDFASLKTEIIAIDPEPRRDVADCASRFIKKQFETLDDGELKEIATRDRLLFFIDSSHLMSEGNDVDRLFHHALPLLKSGTLIHVHDIFLPYGYPRIYEVDRKYREQGVLRKVLESGQYQIELAAHYMSREHGDEMRKVFPPVVGKDDWYYGASFWMSKR